MGGGCTRMSKGAPRGGTRGLLTSLCVLWMQPCRGFAPAYSPEQKKDLKVVLAAARKLFEEALDPVVDSRTGAVPLLALKASSLLALKAATLLALKASILLALNAPRLMALKASMLRTSTS